MNATLLITGLGIVAALLATIVTLILMQSRADIPPAKRWIWPIYALTAILAIAPIYYYYLLTSAWQARTPTEIAQHILLTIFVLVAQLAGIALARLAWQSRGRKPRNHPPH